MQQSLLTLIFAVCYRRTALILDNLVGSLEQERFGCFSGQVRNHPRIHDYAFSGWNEFCETDGVSEPTASPKRMSILGAKNEPSDMARCCSESNRKISKIANFEARTCNFFSAGSRTCQFLIHADC